MLGSFYIVNIIVPHGYNVTGNGKRDMHSETDVSNGKKTCGRSYVETLSDMPYEKNRAKPPISSGYPKSAYADMEVFRDFVNDFESEMACNRQSKPRWKTCP